MKVLLLASLVTLSWCAVTTNAILCKPDHRYVVPQNCSAFILCDKERNPRVFPCPYGLHYNPMKKCCDWPDNVQCTLEDAGQAVREDSPGYASGEGWEGDKVKTEVEVRNVTLARKSEAVKVEGVENKKKVRKEELAKPKPKFGEGTEAKGNVRRISLKVKSSNVKENTNIDNPRIGDGTLSRIPIGHEDKLDFKLEKDKLLEQAIVQEELSDGKYLVNEPREIGKLLHSLKKREDKKVHKTQETVKEEKSSNDEKSKVTSKEIINKHSSVEEKKSVKVETKNVTLKESPKDSEIFTENESELSAFKQSLIEFIMSMDHASFNPDYRKAPAGPLYISEDDEYIPVNLYPTDSMGYKTDIFDPTNSTNETTENETKSETIFTTDNAPASDDVQRTTVSEAPPSTDVPTLEHEKKD